MEGLRLLPRGPKHGGTYEGVMALARHKPGMGGSTPERHPARAQCLRCHNRSGGSVDYSGLLNPTIRNSLPVGQLNKNRLSAAASSSTDTDIHLKRACTASTATWPGDHGDADPFPHVRSCGNPLRDCHGTEYRPLAVIMSLQGKRTGHWSSTFQKAKRCRWATCCWPLPGQSFSQHPAGKRGLGPLRKGTAGPPLKIITGKPGSMPSPDTLRAGWSASPATHAGAQCYGCHDYRRSGDNSGMVQRVGHGSLAGDRTTTASRTRPWNNHRNQGFPFHGPAAGAASDWTGRQPLPDRRRAVHAPRFIGIVFRADQPHAVRREGPSCPECHNNPSPGLVRACASGPAGKETVTFPF